jgi:hypothetical protein
MRRSPKADLKATRMGLITTTGSKDDLRFAPPRFEMIWTITKPATSSIIAALPRITPNRVLTNPVVDRMVNVVPILVEQMDAPAANA